MPITAQTVKELREKTGAGMMDCKKALQEVNGNFEKAVDYLRKKGIADAAKRGGKATSEGLVHSYIHGDGRIGVLVEVNCETDFVARNDKFKEFVQNIALQVAAANPLYVSESDVPEDILEKEREIYKHQSQESKKPANIIDKIVDGKMQKYFDEVCLMRQPYIKNPDQTITDLLKELIAQLGENCQVRRFSRFHLGEGIDKKQEDFAAEVAKQIKQ